MRHRKDHRKLSRTASHRRSVLRNLVTALFQYERIETTVAKAKEARRLAERLITFGKQGDVAARRHVDRFVTKPDVTRKLFATIAPWYTERAGGYTRIVRIGRRLGDAGETALLELVKSPELKEKLRKDAEDAAKAAKAAEKKGGAAKVAKGKAGEAAAAKGGEGEAAAEGGSSKEKRSAKPARGEKFGKKGVPTQHKPTTRARQRGKSGD